MYPSSRWSGMLKPRYIAIVPMRVLLASNQTWNACSTAPVGFTCCQLSVQASGRGVAGTMSLDRLTHEAEKAGAKVLLVGDWGQLQSPGAGGSFAISVGNSAGGQTWHWSCS